MILASLAQSNARRIVAGPAVGYRRATVQWWLDLDASGDLLAATPASEGRGGRLGAAGVVVPAPYVKKTKNVAARLLLGRVAVITGQLTPSMTASQRSRTILERALFCDLVQTCARDTGDPGAVAVERFLARMGRSEVMLPPEVLPDDVCTFRVASATPVIAAPAVQAWWAALQEEAGVRGQCLVCGRMGAIARLHPALGGVAGGMLTGAAMVCSNEPAYVSYGLTQGQSAPVCQGCVHGYTTALGEALHDSDRHMKLDAAGLSVIVWQDGMAPSPLLACLREGRPPTPEDRRKVGTLCALTLSAAGGRMVVRDWFTVDVTDATAALNRFQQRQAVVTGAGPRGFPFRSFGSYVRALGVEGAAGGAAPDGARWAVSILPALLRHALAGSLLPQAVLFHTMRRARRTIMRGEPVNLALVALLQAAVLPGQASAFVPREETAPAYHAGRACAMLELLRIRVHATRGAGHARGVFAVASVTPRAGLAESVREAPVLLRQIGKASAPYAAALEREGQALFAGKASWPERLGRLGQAMFLLGYCYQRAGLLVTGDGAGTRHNDTPSIQAA